MEKELPDVDDRGVISGSMESLTQSDAEAFPDEPEEYQPHECVRAVSNGDKEKVDKPAK